MPPKVTTKVKNKMLLEIKRLQGIEERAKFWLEQIKNNKDIPNDERQWYINKIELVLGTHLGPLK
jgi:hypothetical protein